MSTYGVTGSLTYSVSYPSLDAMLSDLRDNASNSIHAETIRNSVLTLWDLVGATTSVDISSLLYSNSALTTAAVGGISSGITFSNRSIKSIFDSLFYPYVVPSITQIQLGYNNTSYANTLYREFGASHSNFYIKWNISQGSVNLSSATLPIYFSNPGSYTPAGGFAQSGGVYYINVLATQSGVITYPANTNETIYLFVNDGTNIVTQSANLVYQNRIYWGAIAATSSVTNNSAILGLTGASYGSGTTLINTKSGSYNGMNGNGSYLVWAWPTSFGTPTFTINGLISTAFTKATIASFTTNLGYTASYDVWYSNTVQNSPISSLVIS